jgi:predicted permease
MLEGVHHLPPDLIPRAQEIHLRLSVFFALLGATIVATLLSSIAPALIATRSDPQAVLQEGSRGSSFGRGRSRLSGLMVAGEVALSVILLISCGLMFRTLYKLQHIYLGFEQDNITSFIAFPGNAAGFFSFEKTKATSQDQSMALRVYQPMAEKLRQLPGVVDVGYANSLPFEGIDMNTSFDIVGQTRPADEPNKNQALLRAVSGTYVRTMKTSVLRGRAITDEDTATSAYVVMINETMAKRYFAGRDPIGQQIDFAGRGKNREDSGMTRPYTVVGVLADSAQMQIGQPPIPELDLAYPQIPVSSFYYQVLVRQETNYVVKTVGPVEIVSAIRNAFHQAQPEFALDDFKTMQAAHDQADFNQRLGLYLVAAFAGIAVVMVLAGLYGVLSQIVGQRRREIGIRMALGADRALILRMMLQRGLVLIGIGLGVGLLASLAAQQSLKSFLYGVSPMDAATYISVSAVLIAVGMLAAFIPARRAASIEPTQALRAE